MRNRYYYQQLGRLIRFIVPRGRKVLDFGTDLGDLLDAVKPTGGAGVHWSEEMIKEAKRHNPGFQYLKFAQKNLKKQGTFEYVLLVNILGYTRDLEATLNLLHSTVEPSGRLVITFYSYLWEPLIRLGEKLSLKMPQPIQNWLSAQDVENVLNIANFEIVKQGRFILFPWYVPGISEFFNVFLARLPLINRLCLMHYVVARPSPEAFKKKDASVAIIIPARNEAGNIEMAVKRMPRFGKSSEIIFIEGHSNDDTLKEIKRVANKYRRTHRIRYAVQRGAGKGDAVRLGFKMARSEILMILDADLTVAPEDLPKFYKALISGKGELVMGSRLVYPLEKESMRLLNILGNKFFGILFSWILDQRLRDTLCGTKVLRKEDYLEIERNRKFFGEFDPFGDFDLIFGAAKLNRKILEIPIRYGARSYGSTNISRFRHGWMLLKMSFFAMRKIKFF